MVIFGGKVNFRELLDFIIIIIIIIIFFKNEKCNCTFGNELVEMKENKKVGERGEIGSNRFSW